MLSKRFTVTIDADFGSAEQNVLFMSNLPFMLNKLKQATEEYHKGNRITLHITEFEPLKDAIKRERKYKKLGSSMEESFMKLMKNQGVKFLDV